jgi:hypothetical protein
VTREEACFGYSANLCEGYAACAGLPHRAEPKRAKRAASSSAAPARNSTPRNQTQVSYGQPSWSACTVQQGSAPSCPCHGRAAAHVVRGVRMRAGGQGCGCGAPCD